MFLLCWLHALRVTFKNWARHGNEYINCGRTPWSHTILKSKACTKIYFLGYPHVMLVITDVYVLFRRSAEGSDQGGDLHKCKMVNFSFAFVQRIEEKLVVMLVKARSVSCLCRIS